MDKRWQNRTKARTSKIISNICCCRANRSFTDDFQATSNSSDGIAERSQPGTSSSATTKVLNRKGGSRSKKKQSAKKLKIRKNCNIIDNTIVAPTGSDIEEASMRENAFEKFIPLMSSTMSTNSNYAQNTMNATVIVEPVSEVKLNETVVLNKNLAGNIGKNNGPKLKSQEKMHKLEEAMTNEIFQETKDTCQSNALFDPYGNVSVKERVKAFENASKVFEKNVPERSVGRAAREADMSQKGKKMVSGKKNKAADEVAKTDHQAITSQTKYGFKQHGRTTYVLDTEPDDDQSHDESGPMHAIPHWARSHRRENQVAVQRYIPERAVRTFFGSRSCTPDLTSMFENIDRSRLERTSSAIWKTPPRYSMMENE